MLLAWLPGQEGAEAIAETLVGEVNPGGKLPISYPRSSGQIPVFYGHKISGGRSHWKGDYVDGPAAPLYPFGHGLSYTSFELTDARGAARTRSRGPRRSRSTSPSRTPATAPATRSSSSTSATRSASVTRPVLELKSFLRVELPPGASRRVTFDVPVAQLGFHGLDLDYVVEPGVIELFVGTSSADVLPAGSVTVVADASAGAAAEGVRRLGDRRVSGPRRNRRGSEEPLRPQTDAVADTPARGTRHPPREA